MHTTVSLQAIGWTLQPMSVDSFTPVDRLALISSMFSRYMQR
jgi:hypothetical protein